MTKFYVEFPDSKRFGPYLRKWFAEGIGRQMNLDPKSPYFGKGWKIVEESE